jgi:hypothetical protein
MMHAAVLRNLLLNGLSGQKLFCGNGECTTRGLCLPAYVQNTARDFPRLSHNIVLSGSATVSLAAYPSGPDRGRQRPGIFFRMVRETANVAKVLVITSGKGGVGKTTSTAALGVALAQAGQNVVVVDFDIGLRNLDLVTGAERRVVFDLINVIQGVARPARRGAPWAAGGFRRIRNIRKI